MKQMLNLALILARINIPWKHEGKKMVEDISPISVRGAFSINFFQYFVTKIFELLRKLKEFCSKHTYTHCLDSRIILLSLLYHISMHLSFPPSIYQSRYVSK